MCWTFRFFFIAALVSDIFFYSRNIYQIMLEMRAHTDDGVKVRCVVLRDFRPVYKLISVSLCQNVASNLRAERQNNANWPILWRFANSMLVDKTRQTKHPKINANINAPDNADISFN